VSLASSPNKDAALALASRGLRIFPCRPDKTPMVAAWEQAASSSPFDIAVRWDSHPESLPGLPVGAHDIVVIDADRKASGPDGVAAFHALCSQNGIDLSGAFVVETPSRGLHFYFSTPTPYGNSTGSLPDGIDVRGKGGYVIAAGATLPDGRSYRHVHGQWDAIPPLPDALANLLREKRSPVSPALASEVDASLIGERERKFAAAALADEVAKLTAMGEGSGRNKALNDAAHSLGTMEGWIDLNEVANGLWEASIANGYVAKDGEAAAKRTITSGLIAGCANPRPLLGLPAHIEAIDLSPMIRNGIAAYKARQSSKPSESNAKRCVTLLQGSEIQAKPITWLWDGYLPSGKLTLLAGAGGTGKSTLAFSIAGTITNAGTWADGSRCNVAGNVLIWSSEDDPADTIKPRLMAVGANDKRYGVISGTVDENGQSCPFDSARDMDALRDAISRIGGISLLIIDPIVTAVTGDMHKANDVRRSLQAIVDFAAECNCAVLGITHFAKGTAGKNSAERVIGSQAFAALARMVLVAAKEEESDKRVFTRAKSNNSVDTGGFSYIIEALMIGRGIATTRVVWGEALQGSSRSILSSVEGDVSEDTSKLGQAKQYLIEALANQSVGSKELLKQAREGFGISEKTLRRAKDALGIKPQHAPMFEGGWSWSLPTSNLLR
jgi:hypothetical protein